MPDIRDATPMGYPRDDSGGFCCVAAGMHEGHDEDCPGYPCPDCGGLGWEEYATGVEHDGYQEYAKEPCGRCNGGGRI